jgi:hypothetical protein
LLDLSIRSSSGHALIPFLPFAGKTETENWSFFNDFPDFPKIFACQCHLLPSLALVAQVIRRTMPANNRRVRWLSANISQ